MPQLGRWLHIKVAVVTMLIGSASCLLSWAAPAPLIVIDFNDSASGVFVENSGLLKGGFNLVNKTQSASAIITEAGAGVSGKAFDYGLDCSGVERDESSRGGVAESTFVGGGYVSFTATLWIRNLQDLPGPTGILVRGFGIGDSIQANFFQTDKISLLVNGENVAVSTSNVLSKAKGDWVFIAFTYDSRKTDNPAEIWVGSKSENVRDVTDHQIRSVSSGPVAAPTSMGKVTLANGGWEPDLFSSPVPGIYDNFTFYGSESDSSAALSSNEINAVRRSDSTGPP